MPVADRGLVSSWPSSSTPTSPNYTGRIGPSNYQPHESIAVADAKPGEPTVRVEAQRPRADDIGDEKGVKGGTQVAK